MIYLIIQSVAFAVLYEKYTVSQTRKSHMQVVEIKNIKSIVNLGISSQNHPSNQPSEVGKDTIQIFIIIVISSIIISPNNDLFQITIVIPRGGTRFKFAAIDDLLYRLLTSPIKINKFPPGVEYFHHIFSNRKRL